MNKSKTEKYHLQIKHKPHLRADTTWGLYQILENGRSSRDILPIIQTRHDKAVDKAWIQETLFSALRHLAKLQYWTHGLLSKPLKNDKKILEHNIMIGIVQIEFMRTSMHAAVSETVEASKILGYKGLAGLVNGCLRHFEREEVAKQDIPHPHIKFGLPKWFLKKIEADYPEQWKSIAVNSNEKADTFLRINKTQTNVDEFVKALDIAEIAYDRISETAIRLRQNIAITDIPGYEHGWFSVQDLAAQQASFLLGGKNKEVILDCCAAPGGKTSAILEQIIPEQLYAIDVSEVRLSTLKENLKRLKFDSYYHVKVLKADATALVDNQDLPQFDRILLDAPCSASGIIRKHPDIKWLRKRTDVEELVVLQKEILEQVWQKLKVGGTLLYATCSILTDENYRQIKAFIEAHKDAEHIPIHDSDTAHRPGWQILPGENGMDGFYYAKLKKTPQSEAQ